MKGEENIKFRLVLPEGISDVDACYYRDMLQQADIPGMGSVSFVSAPDEDNTMGGALETILGSLGKMISVEPFLEFIQKLVHPIHVKITSTLYDEKDRVIGTYEGEAWTKRAYEKLINVFEKYLKISIENRSPIGVEVKVSSITGEDGKTVSTFDAQGLTSHSASKVIELHKEHLENSQVEIVVSSK